METTNRPCRPDPLEIFWNDWVDWTIIWKPGLTELRDRVEIMKLENRKHQKYFWNVFLSQEISQSGVKNLNRKQER